MAFTDLHEIEATFASLSVFVFDDTGYSKLWGSDAKNAAKRRERRDYGGVIRAKERDYYRANAEKYRERNRRCRVKYKEQIRARLDAKRERTKECARAWYQKNKEKITAAKRARRAQRTKIPS